MIQALYTILNLPGGEAKGLERGSVLFGGVMNLAFLQSLFGGRINARVFGHLLRRQIVEFHDLWKKKHAVYLMNLRGASES